MQLSPEALATLHLLAQTLWVNLEHFRPSVSKQYSHTLELHMPAELASSHRTVLSSSSSHHKCFFLHCVLYAFFQTAGSLSPIGWGPPKEPPPLDITILSSFLDTNLGFYSFCNCHKVSTLSSQFYTSTCSYAVPVFSPQTWYAAETNLMVHCYEHQIWWEHWEILKGGK